MIAFRSHSITKRQACEVHAVPVATWSEFGQRTSSRRNQRLIGRGRAGLYAWRGRPRRTLSCWFSIPCAPLPSRLHGPSMRATGPLAAQPLPSMPHAHPPGDVAAPRLRATVIKC